MKKAAIMGWWYNQNYGSILTYYSLNRYLKREGYETTLIDGPTGYKNRSPFRKWMPLPYKFFKEQGMPYTEQLDKTTITNLNDNFDTFILGSDQMWNPWNGWVDDDDFFDFVYPSKKKIAYSVSLGKDDTSKYNSSWVSDRKKDLTQFDFISMREDFSVRIMEELFDKKVPRVLDPVYLTNAKDYRELSDTSPLDLKGKKYIAVFFLDINSDKARIAKLISKKMDLPLLVIPNPLTVQDKTKEFFSKKSFDYIADETPQSFLKVYDNAEYIITDSFHGSVFATVFEKPFSVFFNEKRGADRFNSIMDLYEFDEKDRRLFESSTDSEILSNNAVNFNIDYSSTRAKIKKEVKESSDWLRKSLLNNKQYNDSETYDAFRDFITKKSFDFYRAKEKEPISSGIMLSPNGTIKNSNSNESFWSLSKDELIFMDQHKEITTRFDRSKFQEQETFHPFRIVGDYIKAKGVQHVMYIHPEKKVQVKNAEEKNKVVLAVPEDMLSRKELISKIVKSSSISKQKRDLLSKLPNLDLYVGRELKEYTNNFVGGPADILIFPKTVNEIKEVVKYAKQNNISITFIGKGSNVLVRDGGIRGITIITTSLNSRRIEDNVLVASAGADLIETSYYLLENLKKGLEWADNIPGTIGGAVFMNAGTVRDIKSMFIEATIIDENGEFKILRKDDVIFKHRYSSFMEHPNWIILEVKLAVSDGNLDSMINDMISTVEVREKMHPLTLPNHGSTFTWGRAPRLIKQAGLAGTRIGGAKISEKHPGFFINIDQATAQDYEALIYHTISEVYKFSGFLLKPEVIMLGNNMWEASVFFK